jgi:hypothetical protein
LVVSSAEPEAPLSPVLIEGYGCDQDHADEDVLVERVYVDDLKAVVDLSEQDGPQCAAGDGAAAAEQGCPADDDGGDDLKGKVSPP